jgi:putative copper export protein/methionine-rich copper-binding protein CopC
MPRHNHEIPAGRPGRGRRPAPVGWPAAPWLRVLAGGALIVPVLAAASPPAARALLHTALQASYPAADSLYREEVREVRLRYSTPVQLSLSTIRLERADGTPVETGPVETVPASEAREIRVSVGTALGSGRYTVRWTTAGPDSHPLNGSYVFRVERPAIPASAPAGEVVSGDRPLSAVVQTEGSAPARDPLGALVKSLFLLSILAMLGTSMFRLAVLGPLAGDPQLEPTLVEAATHTRGLAAAAAGLAFASVPTRLWKQSADLFGANALGAESLGRIIDSPWGTAWMLQAAMAALFVAGLVGVGPGDRRMRGWWVMLAAGVGSAIVPALSGHAAGLARAPALAVVNDALHVTAAGAWMGTLAVLLIAGLPALTARRAQPGPAFAEANVRATSPAASGVVALDSSDPLPPLARMVNTFSRVAMLAVAALVITGGVSAWLQLGSLGALLESAYGVTLLVKLALVAAAASVGLYNWRVVRPALLHDPRPGRLRASATTEALLGFLIVLVTGVLIATPLPTP